MEREHWRSKAFAFAEQGRVYVRLEVFTSGGTAVPVRFWGETYVQRRVRRPNRLERWRGVTWPRKIAAARRRLEARGERIVARLYLAQERRVLAAHIARLAVEQATKPNLALDDPRREGVARLAGVLRIAARNLGARGTRLWGRLRDLWRREETRDVAAALAAMVVAVVVVLGVLVVFSWFWPW